MDERLSWPVWFTYSGRFSVYPHKWSPVSYRSSAGQGNTWPVFEAWLLFKDLWYVNFILVCLSLISLMGQYCFARCRLSASSAVVCNARAVGRCRARGQSGGRHCTAGQYGYIPSGRHLV